MASHSFWPRQLEEQSCHSLDGEDYERLRLGRRKTRHAVLDIIELEMLFRQSSGNDEKVVAYMSSEAQAWVWAGIRN